MEVLGVILILFAILSLILSPILAFVALSRIHDAFGALEALRRRIEKLERPQEPAPGEAGARAEGVSPAGRPVSSAVARAGPGEIASLVREEVETSPSEPVAPAYGPAAAAPPVRAPVADSAAPAPPRTVLHAAPPAPPPAIGVPAVPSPGPPGLPSPATVEEHLGAQLFVWIGAVALALAGVFLVKYAFDRNLLTPPMRVALGSMFGIALLALGEWMRRRSRRIAEAVTAASVADLYACILAAVNLYHLIHPVLGFAFMMLVTAAAVLLSLRQGPIVAVVGLIGGFAMPIFLRTEEPKPAGLFGYFLLLEVGLVVVARAREWWAIAALNLAASAIWALGWTAGIWMNEFPGDHGLWVGLYLIASAAAFVASDIASPGETGTAPRGAREILACAAMGLAILGLCLLTAAVDFATLQWYFLGALCAGCILLGRLSPRYEGFAPFAALAALALLASWHSAGIQEEHEHRFALTALGLGALHACGGYACLWGAALPAVWTILSAASVVGYFLVAYWALWPMTFLHIGWGYWSLILAAACAAAAIPVARARARLPQGGECLAALAVAATALVSFAVPMELEREWIAVAWAVEVAALAWLEGSLRVPALRVLGAILAAAVAIRLLLNPNVLRYPTGDTVIWNWLLYGYGIPVLSFVAAAWIFRRRRDDETVQGLEWGALALGLALLTLQIRHFFHPGKLDARHFEFLEWATLSVCYTVYGVGLLAARRFCARPSIHCGGAIAGVLGLGLALVAQGLAVNPLLKHQGVGGTPVLNWLLYAYGAPAVLGIALSLELSRHDWKGARVFVSVASLLLIFALVSLEVRQAFQGSFLDGPSPSTAEWYAYSAAWIVLASALLVVGILTRGIVVRYASLVVMLVAVFKVFLFDTRELRDLYRVFSFLCLGASLLFLAFLYQRFVFRRGED